MGADGCRFHIVPCSAAQLSCTLFPDPKTAPKGLGGMILRGPLDPNPTESPCLEIVGRQLNLPNVPDTFAEDRVFLSRRTGYNQTLYRAVCAAPETVFSLPPSQNTSVKSRKANQLLVRGYTKQPP